MNPDIRQQLIELALSRQGGALRSIGGFGRLAGGRRMNPFQTIGRSGGGFPLPGMIPDGPLRGEAGPLIVLARRLGQNPRLGRF